MNGGALIREARLRTGLTQRELATRVGTTQSSIARWETGGSRPPLETVEALVRECGLELNVSLDEPDTAAASLIERNLALSPAERLDQLVRAVAFIRSGRRALASRRG